ncbi:MAG: prolyl-tRNA synthetase [Candidatus Vogelbacteria bacterium]|nr:prolyl-tRNA synthetase [Candidatus Vogelbacteria bacterium]
MLQSHLFTKTRKEGPKNEVSANANFLIRAGFIHKEMAGVYDYLPLGLRVIENIRNIIREEMNALGCQEVSLSALQDPEIWNKSGRWSDDVVDVWFKTKLKNDVLLGLGATHEEPMVRMVSEHVRSYRDLPLYTYQFQTKFRNELRSKSGIMRGREFLMKDMYSFCRSEAELDAFYDKAALAYKKIFERVGIGDRTYFTFASGGMFSKFSHEFQTVCGAGEDFIYIDEEKRIAVNDEVMQDDILKSLGIERSKLRKEKSIEVGNIFKYGTRYTKELGLNFMDEDGNEQPVINGAYGIGLGRLMGTVVEIFADAKGLVWPEAIAPFKFHLIEIVGGGDTGDSVRKEAIELYDKLNSNGVSVLYDDRDLRAGEKFGDSDLIGIPWRIVVSSKTGTDGPYEVKNRKTGEVKMVTLNEILEL